MHHLLDTATFVRTPSPIRTQACEAISDVVLAAMELVTCADGLTEDDNLNAEGINPCFVTMVANGDAQLRILTPLSQMMTGVRSSTGTEDSQEFGQFIEVCKLTLDTLNRLLQASGHSIMRAWDVVFDIIQSVVASGSVGSTHGVGGSNAESRQPGYLVRFAFPCLQLICTDYLADLPANCMRRCIQSLVEYGQQTEDLNISLTAIGQVWSLSDFFQRARQTSDGNGVTEPDELVSSKLVMHTDDSKSAVTHIVDGWWAEDLVSLEDTHTRQVLWLLLLHSLSSLGRDGRHEVRHGALQTLFRTLDMHGETFDTWAWDSIIWTVLAPVLDRALAERARVFDLIRQGHVEMLMSELEAEQMASKSGVVMEDPSRLHKKQWDETAATAVLGAAKVWRDNLQRSIRHIGFVDQAWQIMWSQAIDFLTGRRSTEGTQLLPVAGKTIEVDVSDAFIDSVAAEISDSQLCLRTRESVATAIECVAALVGIADLDDVPTDQAVSQHWRIVWRAWLTIGTLMTSLPKDLGSLLDINQTADGSIVYSQEVLLSYLHMFPQIFGQLRSCRWFSEYDCAALLKIARRLLVFVDAPLYSADVLEITKLQAQIMEAVWSLQTLSQNMIGGEDRLVSPDTVLSLALGELAIYAVIPYVIRPALGGTGTLYGESKVIDRARDIFSVQLQRLDAHSVAATEVKKSRSGKT
ncbi:Endocytosis and vacuole integrity protein, partial [Linderina macrospora]